MKTKCSLAIRRDVFLRAELFWRRSASV